MAIESLVALGLATLFLVGLAWYANTHRAPEKPDELELLRGELAELRTAFAELNASARAKQ